jgi:hypothetical protein
MKPCKEATLTETAQGAFVLDMRTGRCFALNQLGVHVWNNLKDGKSPDEIVTLLERRYAHVPRAKLLDDVNTFITGLERRQLVTP